MIGVFLYYFVVKALNADIDGKYRKAKTVQHLCGIFTVAAVIPLAPLCWTAWIRRQYAFGKGGIFRACRQITGGCFK